MTQWFRDIRRITQLNHEVEQGSTLQEINFWTGIERSLSNIETQINHNLTDVTKQLLRQAQKIQLVYRFEFDTELEQKLKTAKDYNKLLKDFPINTLLSANDFEDIKKAIE